jgi:hypothetical protein
MGAAHEHGPRPLSQMSGLAHRTGSQEAECEHSSVSGLHRSTLLHHGIPEHARQRCQITSVPPNGNEPGSRPGSGCAWWYNTSFCSGRIIITSRVDAQKYSAWETLSFCACGCFAPPVPCPQCADNHVEKKLTDTFSWSISTTDAVQTGLALKAELTVQIGYPLILSQQEQLSLSGTHVEEPSYTLHRQPVMCFTRYFRQTWGFHSRSGVTRRDWTYHWNARDAGGALCEPLTSTLCTETVAKGTVTCTAGI